MTRRVWYHANCADGFGAAYAVWKRFPDSEFTPVHYQQDPPSWDDGDDIWIVDFSYPREVLEGIASKAGVRVIDHHASAKVQLEGLPYARFREHESGAVATWKNLHDAPVPLLLQYVQDRDLWRWELDGSRAVSYALRYTVDTTFEAWDGIVQSGTRGIAVLRRRGEILCRMVDAQVEAATGQAVEMQLPGLGRVPVVNSTVFISEIGQALASSNPSRIGVVWFHSGRDGRINWSLRSSKDGPDVSEIARRFGGGGHVHAAGFATPMALTTRPGTQVDLSDIHCTGADVTELCAIEAMVGDDFDLGEAVRAVQSMLENSPLEVCQILGAVGEAMRDA